jgi:hypothetical protein
MRNGEQIYRHSVAVERINTFILKSTYTNTHGSSFTRSKPIEALYAISCAVPSCGFVLEITLYKHPPLLLLQKHLLKGCKV